MTSGIEIRQTAMILKRSVNWCAIRQPYCYLLLYLDRRWVQAWLGPSRTGHYLLDTYVPLPWLDKSWPADEDAHNSSALSTGKGSSTRGSASMASLDPWADMSHEFGTAMTRPSSTAPVATQTPPQQDSPSQPTGYRTKAILWLVGLGLLVLLVILVMVAASGHGAGFSGAHGAYRVHGMSR
jgi:hypothetical protein